MKILIEEKTIIKFFKWVILTKTIIKDQKIISSEPIYLNNKEYFEKEFNNN